MPSTFGDWREEVVWRTADSSALRIYSTPVPTDRRLYSDGMVTPPQPNVYLA